MGGSQRGGGVRICRSVVVLSLGIRPGVPPPPPVAACGMVATSLLYNHPITTLRPALRHR